MPNEKTYRYPGVTPFSTEQSEIFFGRKKDIEVLYRFVKREKLVVLYGKSGLGKSSLLNAGIVPLALENKDLSPISIRFNAWTSSSAETPLDKAKNAIRSQKNKESFLNKLLPEDNSLWLILKNKQILEKSQPLLIFDQFEELFSYPTEQIIEFQKDLTELLSTNIPLRFIRKIDEEDNITDEEDEALETNLHARIIFAIRSDRMHLLDRLKNYIPTVLKNTYELKPLTIPDAKNAILMPAQAKGNFATPIFEFSDGAIEILLSFLKNVEEDEERIEGILLQMLCEHFERNLVQKSGITSLNKEHISNPENIVKKYYEEKINSLEPQNQKFAKQLIEEGLLSDGEPAMRLTLHESSIEKKFYVDQDLIEELVEMRLLRAEPFIRGGYTYELSHDRLVEPVVEARGKSRTEKNIQKEEEQQRALEAAEKKAKEEQKLREEAERYAKRASQFSMLSAIVSILAISAAIFGGWNYFKANNALKQADKSAKEANIQKEIAEKALDNFKIEKHKKEKIEFTQRLERIQIVLEGGNCPDTSQLMDLDTMGIYFQTDSILQDEIKFTLIKTKKCR